MTAEREASKVAAGEKVVAETEVAPQKAVCEAQAAREKEAVAEAARLAVEEASTTAEEVTSTCSPEYIFRVHPKHARWCTSIEAGHSSLMARGQSLRGAPHAQDRAWLGLLAMR